MPAAFYEQFNFGLDDAESAFEGETWTFNGRAWPAISIDDVRLARVAGGVAGPLGEANVTLYVRQHVYVASGVLRGSKIIVRGQSVRVMSIGDDGDDGKTLICGPLGAPLPAA